MDEYLSLSRAINIIKIRLKKPLFDINYLRSCIENEDLELTLELIDPSVFYIETNNYENWFDPDRIYELKGAIFATPVKPYKLGKLVPEDILFDWENTIYKLWSCKNKRWTIKRSVLDFYLESPPSQPEWVSLCTGTVATHLIEIWEFRWNNVKKDIPNVKLLIKTLKENPNAAQLKNYSLSDEDSLIHIVDNVEGWKTTQLNQAWNGIFQNYKNSK